MKKLIFLILLISASTITYGQEYTTKTFKRTIESIGYSWDFERRYLAGQAEKEPLIVSPGNYLEMKLYDNELWFKDWSSMNFRILDLNTQKEQVRGKRGPGPYGENGQIMFFDKTDEGVHLYDFDKRTLKGFSTESFEMLNSSQNKEIAFYRGAYLGDARYLLRYDNSLNDHGFSFIVYNAETKSTEKIYNVAKLLGVEEFSDMEMSYSGRFVTSTDRKHIFYYCDHGGRVFKFDGSGTFEFTKATVDKTPIPGVKKHEFGSGYAPRPTLGVEFFLDAAANETHLILLNILEKGEGHVVDFYNVKDGKYDYSLHISDLGEQEAALIAANNNSLYVMYEENDIVKYELK